MFREQYNPMSGQRINGKKGLSDASEKSISAYADSGRPRKKLDLSMHVPVVESRTGTVWVKVGAKPHPMTTSHHITRIEIHASDAIQAHRFKTSDKAAVAEFYTDAAEVIVSAHCNIHGTWSCRKWIK